MNATDRISRIPARHIGRHGRVMAVSMMKDEGPFLLEWVAHHMAVGFTDLLVYTNDCSDGTDDMLIRLEELGLAMHRRNVIPDGVKPQPSALKYATDEPEVAKSDWLMVFDADEFLSIRHGDGTLDDLIDGIKDAGAQGMVITWRIFGSGGVVDWSRDFVTEQYRMAAPQMWNKGWGVKTLFRFDPDKWKLGIHRPKLLNKVLDTDFPASVQWLNGSGRPMEDYFKFRGWRSIVRTIGYDWAQMNHYAVKSADSYAMRKFRGNVNNKKDKYNDAYWALQDRNEVRDDTMLRYSARRREIFEGLLSDPELSRLHHGAVEKAEAQLAAFKATPEYDDFIARLKVAGAVPITQVEAKPPKARDPAEIAAKMRDVKARGDMAAGDADTPRAAQPVDQVVRGAVDISADVPLDWHPNHSVDLPADPRIFTPAALITLTAGKYERNLARNLPALLPAGGRYLELGATTGFVGCHLAQTGVGVHVVLHQRDPGWRGVLARIMARNGLDLPVLHTDLTGLPDLVAGQAPGLLSIGDPDIGRDGIAAILRRHRPSVLILTGPLWCVRHDARAAYEAVIAAAGYGERLGLDPALAAGYRQGARRE